jgi:putative molybdopterin biosynthesis protein
VATIETAILLSVGETAHMLRVSKATAYRLIERGELRAHRVGGQLRVDLDTLRDYLAKGQTS